MVISFMLPWTGDIIHNACFEVKPHRFPRSAEKPDQERVFVAALCVNINY